MADTFKCANCGGPIVRIRAAWVFGVAPWQHQYTPLRGFDHEARPVGEAE